MVKADHYVELHSNRCLFNPAVAEKNTHRWEAETAEATAHREAEATARREAEAPREATKAATVARREAIEDEERGEQRDYLRQQEAARMAADTARHQGAPLRDLPARVVGPKPAPFLRSSMERQMSQQEWQQFAKQWSRYKAVALEPWNYS